MTLAVSLTTFAVMTLLLCWSEAQQLNPSNNTGCVPKDLPDIDVDPEKMLGTWYEYMYRFPNFVAFDTTMTYTSIGSFFDSNYRKVVAMEWLITYKLLPDLQCSGQYSQQNYSSTGNRDELAFADGNPPAPNRLKTLYADPEYIEITSACLSPLFTSEGCCTLPAFIVNIRKRPYQLTTQEKAELNALIDTKLQPYKLTHSDLQITPQTNCPDVAKAESYITFVDALRTNLAK